MQWHSSNTTHFNFAVNSASVIRLCQIVVTAFSGEVRYMVAATKCIKQILYVYLLEYNVCIIIILLVISKVVTESEQSLPYTNISKRFILFHNVPPYRSVPKMKQPMSLSANFFFCSFMRDTNGDITKTECPVPRTASWNNLNVFCFNINLESMVSFIYTAFI